MGNITSKNYKEFKKAYKTAISKKKKRFIFEDQEVLVSYAGYLIEHVELTTELYKTIKKK